jgi:hypothetical protein
MAEPVLEVEHAGTPAQLRACLKDMAAHLASGDERGCPLANAAVELPDQDHPARRVTEALKTAQRAEGRSLSAQRNPAGRLLFDLIREIDNDEGSAFSPADSYMRLAHYLRCPTRGPPQATLTSCSPGSATLSRMALPIQILAPVRWLPKQDIPALPAEALYSARLNLQRISSICFVWSMPHSFCIEGRCWAQASLSVKSPTPLALPTTPISHENFATGSVTHQAPTP